MEKTKPFYSALANFEETYKTVYTHGLEEIYAIEAVDLSSVKPLQKEGEIEKAPKKYLDLQGTYQLCLPFSAPFLQYVDHFLLQEPIEVLLLSERVEEALKDAGCYYLYELLSQDFQALALEKKLGSGHIQEIQKSLHEHIQSDRLYHVQDVDFAAFCRALIPPLLFVQAASLAKEFGIEELFPLRPRQKVEVKSAGEEKKEQWKRRLFEEMKAYDRRQLFLTLFGKVMQVFVMPWMRRRQGIASFFEIEERLHNVSFDKTLSAFLLEFVSSFYFGSLKELLSVFLVPCEENVFAVSDIEKHLYQVAQKQTSTYFFGTDKISFTHLISLMEREAASFWFDFPEGFLERFFKVTSQVHFVRLETGQVFLVENDAVKPLAL